MVAQNNDGKMFTHIKVIQLILILLRQKSSIYDIATDKSDRKCTVDKNGLINVTLHVIPSL